MRVDPRFLVESGTEIFTGCELLLKGCLETPGGVALLTQALTYSLETSKFLWLTLGLGVAAMRIYADTVEEDPS